MARLSYLASTLFLALCSQLMADTIVLDNGGRVHGHWLNPDKRAKEPYVFRFGTQAEVKIEARRVAHVDRQSEAEAAYARIAPQVKDSAEQQWKMAQWCGERYLVEQRKSHLRRVIQLDPDHQQARHALGYRFVDNEWTTEKQFRGKYGYRRYRGQWRLEQEIRLIEDKAQRERVLSDWKAKIQRWNEDLGGEDAAAAKKALLAVEDPAAVTVLSGYYAKASSRAVKTLYLDAINSISSEQTISTLVMMSLTENDEELFHEIVDRIVAKQRPDVPPVYAKLLGNANNRVVKRAALVLSQLRDPSTTRPLIESLITTHVVVKGTRKHPDQITTTFSQSDNPQVDSLFDGFGMETGDGRKAFPVRVRNAEALDALVDITGVNFGYDQAAWRSWFVRQNQFAGENFGSR